MNSFALCAILAAIISRTTCSRLNLLVEDTNDNRIYDGEDAELGQFPYQVALRRNLFPDRPDIGHCGGSIIGKRWVLTAAHCFRNGTAQPDLNRIYVGTIDFDGGSMYEVERIILHPEHDGKIHKADVALVRSKKPIKFSKTVKPIALSRRFVNADAESIVSGWGYTSKGPAEILIFLTVYTLSNAECATRIPHDQNMIHNKTLCGVGTRFQHTCTGDSGGPLVENGQLIGVVSWSYVPCFLANPDGYMWVSAFAEWIQQLTGIFAV